MLSAYLTHVCRHNDGLKISPEACERQRRKAQNADRLPYDQRYHLEKCVGCEGPLPLDKPVAVEVSGAEPRPPRNAPSPSAPEPPAREQKEQTPSGGRGAPQERRPAPSPPAGGEAAPEAKPAGAPVTLISPVNPGPKMSKKRRLALHLARLLADRNARLKRAVNQRDYEVAALAAHDVMDLVDLLITQV
jgi:hypothetical protein